MSRPAAHDRFVAKIKTLIELQVQGLTSTNEESKTEAAAARKEFMEIIELLNKQKQDTLQSLTIIDEMILNMNSFLQQLDITSSSLQQVDPQLPDTVTPRIDKILDDLRRA